MKKALIFLMSLWFSVPCFAQKTNQDTLRIEFKAIVEDLQYQLEKLGNSYNTQSVRKYASEMAKSLFINKGGYYTYQMNGQSYRDKCELEIISRFRPNLTYRNLVKKYLDILTNCNIELNVTAVKSFYVDNVKKIDTGICAATVHLFSSMSSTTREQNVHNNCDGYKTMVIYIDCNDNDNLKIYLEDCQVECIGEVPIDLQND